MIRIFLIKNRNFHPKKGIFMYGGWQRGLQKDWQKGVVKRRGLIDIYADILSAIDRGACRTHIVYRANLNFNRCKRYISDLSKGGLIKIQTNSPSTWTVTNRGHEFLKKHRELRGLLSQ